MIKRALFEALKTHLSQKEITLLIGPRQAGKTTLMLRLLDDLKSQGERTMFLNLDIETHKRHVDSQETLLKKIELEIGKARGYVFLDEIQRKANAGVFLKGLYDMGLPYKFIVSGSGALELKEKIHESLAGRKRVFELSTLTFSEFVNFKTGYKYEHKLEDFFTVESFAAKKFLEEYLSFGGYPKVVLAETADEKYKVVEEIYQSYLEKDIAYLLGITKSEAFTHLVKILAAQAGRIARISELASTIGISSKTVKNYLWYLEKTFLLSKVSPYFRNIRKEITKSPIFYFTDLGLRNYAAGSWGQVLGSADVGFVFQNFVFQLIKEYVLHTPDQLYFWRTKDKAEVDFILEKGSSLIPVEAKFQETFDGRVARSLRNFLSKYHPVRAYIIYLGPRQEKIIEKTKVDFIPFYELVYNPLV